MNEQTEIKIEDCARLELAPGDVIVYRHPKRLTDRDVSNVRMRLREGFPDNLILVLDDGAELAAVRPRGSDSALADRLEALTDQLAADTASKGTAALQAILSLRNEIDALRGV